MGFEIFKIYQKKAYTSILDVLGLIASLILIFQLDAADLVFKSILDMVMYCFTAILSIFFIGGYKVILRYTSFIDIIRVTISLLLAHIIFIFYLGIFDRVTLRYILLLFYFSTTVLVSYRIAVKLIFSYKESVINTPILLFGAGNNGTKVLKMFQAVNKFDIKGFIDDDISKSGRTIDGIKISNIENDKVSAFLIKNKIKQVIITTDKVKPERRRTLFEFFKNYGINVLDAPQIDSLMESSNKIELKQIKIEDLLSRDKIDIDIDLNRSSYLNKSILVTGAAGSIGSEIVRQLIHYAPKKIILLDTAETPLFNLNNELRHIENIEIVPVLGSVTDGSFLINLFNSSEIEIVFHAAAYKHVLMMEAQPKLAIHNNIYGTKNILDLSVKNNVNRVVLISTDKAVNPSNVMGASKRIAELYLTSHINQTKTQLIITRFGNVLGSNGSVVPIFKEQIEAGGPVTITHPDITRFFMTIPEASQLVLEAGAIGGNGEIFVFDMGEPVKINDLAINMIRLSGLKEGEDIKIEYTGLRPGEKLYEELLANNEKLIKSHNDLIFKSQKEVVSDLILEKINFLLNESLKETIENDFLVKLMKEIVPEFKSMNSKYEKLD